MPVELQGENFPLSSDELGSLWSTVVRRRGTADDVIVVRCVGVEEIRALNKRYGKKDRPTNVLTFSYPATGSGEGSEHDVALCLAVAREEAAKRGANLRDYVALLLVHAMLHASGLDHEEARDRGELMAELEIEILRARGFQARHL